jgi:F420H(2)-dependent quinone reductase
VHKFFTKVNLLLYHLSHGHLGNRMGGQSVLILQTTGRRTGKPRQTTLSYYRDGPRYLVVASNWGKEVHPDWYFNLQMQPIASIQVGQQRLKVEAHTAQPDEYDRLWQLVTRKNSQFTRYQDKMERHIPIVILVPQ